MAVNQVGANTGMSFQTNAATDRAHMSRDQFLNMLVSELQNQDPMEPMDNGKLLEQLMQMQMLESTSALTDGINTLMKFQTLATASGMIGKSIQGISDSGESVTGMVSQVSMQNNEVRLMVNGQPVALGNVQLVLNPAGIS